MSPKQGTAKKSWKAGKSSKFAKSSKSAKSSPASIPEGKKSGFKDPLSLLHERCQRFGWNKPTINTLKHPNGWSFVIILSKLNKDTAQTESALLEPQTQHLSPTASEARHWGAIYALYQVCNTSSPDFVLPPGPRAYWDQLAAEHSNAQQHLEWICDTNPPAARQEVNVKHANAAFNYESTAAKKNPVSSEFSHVPIVKMAMPLMEVVEDAVKKAIPEAGIASSLFSKDASKIIQELGHLGFTDAQCLDAVTFLSQFSPLASNLLGSLPSLEAAIEYLTLNIPQYELPRRLLPSTNSSSSITSARWSRDELRHWIEDKAIKEACWPAHVVKDWTVNSNLLSWDRLLVALGKRLIGEGSPEEAANSDPYDIDTDEVEVLGGFFVDPTELIIPLPNAPIQIHVLISPDSYPRPSYAPMYITSTMAPPYICLHLLSRILIAIKTNSLEGLEEGFCRAVSRCLEGEWAKIEYHGPPTMSTVLKNLIPNSQAYPETDLNDNFNLAFPNKRTTRRHRGHLRPDDRHNNQIRNDFEAICRSDKYVEMLTIRQKLPAFKAREEFLQRLEENRVLLVVGETGSGKTTQFPQFILDSLILSGRGSEASIIVTQPRRISALSVAARVSAERVDDGSVGYATRGASKQHRRTKLVFCTTGVVLRRLGSGDMLQGVSHIVVDEVHERSIDGDFLLLELKELLKRHHSLKVILMSATINHETFMKYFDGASLVTLPGFAHPVADRYLEDIMPLIHYRPSRGKSTKKNEAVEEAYRDELKSQGLDDQSIISIHNIVRADHIDPHLIAAVVNHIISSADKRGGVLIFLPGVYEIYQCIDVMRSLLTGKQADIFPLHAGLSDDEQQVVFAKTSNWKIIAATNVAETSITIDDIIYVVDSGKVKENQYDPDTDISRLTETRVTQAAARQRRGRAGRTQPGICYKLFTRKQESGMGKYPVPEILRVPLEKISLTIRLMREDEDVKQYLSRAIDPPKTIAMEKAWSVLEVLGAVDGEGKLTPLGRHMAMLPTDPRIAKMLILGTLFQCLGPILTIAASLSSKPLFLNPVDRQREATKARARFSNAESDLLTDLKAYDECTRPGRTRSTMKTFCEENFVSSKTVREITSLRNDFVVSLADLGFIPLSSTPSAAYLNVNSTNMNLLKAVILGGLWPRVARIHLPKPAAKLKSEKTQAGTIQREVTAGKFKIFDLCKGSVSLHPTSVLFGATAWKSQFLVYFHKYMSTRVLLRDATEIPIYALLLFGGQVSVDHIAGDISIASNEFYIKLKASPRIGILVNQLRRLLDVQLERCVEKRIVLEGENNNPILSAILALLSHDGLTE